MKTTSLVYLTAATASVVSAQRINGPEAFLGCNGYRRPKWDDCDKVVEHWEFKDNEDFMHENGEQGWDEPSCKWWFWEDGNCKITHCFSMTNEEANIGDDQMEVTGVDLMEDYKRIKDTCPGWRAGGYTETDYEFTEIFNDEDEGSGGNSSSDDDDKKKIRKRSPKLDNVKRSPEGFTTGHSSYEEYLAWKNDTSSKEETISRHAKPTHAEKKARRAAVLQNKRRSGKILSQRDDIEDDNDYWLTFEAIGVRDMDTYDVGLRLSPGAGYKYETTESTTFSVTTSLEMGAAFDIFTASMSYEVSEEESYSITEGLTFDVDCSNQGQVFFYPYFDYYEAEFRPSETDVEIWLPVVSDKKVNGEIAVNCLG